MLNKEVVQFQVDVLDLMYSVMGVIAVIMG